MKYVVHKNGRMFAFKDGKYRPIKYALNHKGYHMATTYSLNGPRLTRSVHRIVAKAYLLNPDGKPQVNHRNGVKTDNCVSNLEWCTPKENTVHALETGLRKPGNQGGSIHWYETRGHWIGQLRHCGQKYRKVSVNRAKVDSWLKKLVSDLEGA
jgi:hypothetical protein